MPRVYEDGTVTIVIGQELGSCSVHVDSMEIGYLTSIEVISDQLTQKVHMKFAKSDDRDLSMKIEESVRIAKTLPWVEIKD